MVEILNLPCVFVFVFVFVHRWFGKYPKRSQTQRDIRQSEITVMVRYVEQNVRVVGVTKGTLF